MRVIFADLDILIIQPVLIRWHNLWQSGWTEIGGNGECVPLPSISPFLVAKRTVILPQEPQFYRECQKI